MVIGIGEAACDKHGRSETLPFRILPPSRFPALPKLPGHIQPEEDRWSADGNSFMSHPTSDRIPQGVTWSTRGMVRCPNHPILKRPHTSVDLLPNLAPFRFREAQMIEQLFGARIGGARA